MTNIKGGPCHHDMARHRVADGGDGLQIWSVAANIVNKQAVSDSRQLKMIQFGGGW